MARQWLKAKTTKMFHVKLVLPILLAWSLNVDAVSAAASAKIESSKKVVKMETPSLYPTAFASSLRGSFISTKTSAKGKITWSKPTGLAAANKYWPAAVLLWNKHQVVTAHSDIVLFDPNGNKVWSKKKQIRAPLTVGGELLYFKNPSRFLDAIDIDGKKILDSGPFPGGMGENEVEFFFPRKDDFVAVMFDNDQRDHDQGDENPRPTRPILNLVKNRYSITYGDWLEKLDADDHLAPLFLPEKSVLSLLSGGLHFRIDMNTEKRLSEVPVGFESPTEWSLDRNDVFYILATEKSQLVMLAYRIEGMDLKNSKKKDQWRWESDPKNTEAWVAHPPAVGPSGKVYALTTSRLIALENGKLLWQNPVQTAKDEMSFISILADESLLLANGKVLSFLSPDGKLKWKVEVASEILSSPVVDEVGNIFVTTATDLVRIN